MQNLELTYFSAKFPRGEMLRLALTIGNVPFTNTALDFSEFLKRKAAGAFPFGSLPVLAIDGELISQSGPLAVYCAKLAGLHPVDDIQALKVDEFIGGMDDALRLLVKHSDPQARAACARTDATQYLGGLEALAKKNRHSQTWVTGPKLTVADLAIYSFIGLVKEESFLIEGVPKDLFDDYPRLMAAFRGVHEHPKVVEWNKTHPLNF